MGLEHSPARGRAAYSVLEFCDAHRISKGTLYNMWKRGAGPRWMSIGVRRIITIEAAADWRAQCEAAAEKAAKSA